MTMPERPSDPGVQLEIDETGLPAEVLRKLYDLPKDVIHSGSNASVLIAIHKILKSYPEDTKVQVKCSLTIERADP